MSIQACRPSLPTHLCREPWLEISADGHRIAELERATVMLEAELGRSHRTTQYVRSWAAVSHGAEYFKEEHLLNLQESEPALRVRLPFDPLALAMNLAAQGCCAWFVRNRAAAIPMLSEAHALMLEHQVGYQADVVKVAEVLADCLMHCERVDDAARTLYRMGPYMAAAAEQSPKNARMFDELRRDFLRDYGRKVSPGLNRLKKELRSFVLPTHATADQLST